MKLILNLLALAVLAGTQIGGCEADDDEGIILATNDSYSERRVLITQEYSRVNGLPQLTGPWNELGYVPGTFFHNGSWDDEYGWIEEPGWKAGRASFTLPKGEYLIRWEDSGTYRTIYVRRQEAARFGPE